MTRREDIHRIFHKLSLGIDIRPHLSRNIRFGYERKSPRKKGGRDIDGLLNEWGVHHLHLSHTVEDNGFVERGKEVLAIIFRPSDAFVLDIISHGEWAEQRLVEAALHNWPREELFPELKGIAPGQPYSNEERVRLRAAGINTWVEIDGRCYIAATGGISTALTPARIMAQTARLLSQLRAIEADPSILMPGFRSTVGFKTKVWPRRPRYRVIAASTQDRFSFVILEEVTGLAHGLSV
jgi:hypothetical protein